MAPIVSLVLSALAGLAFAGSIAEAFALFSGQKPHFDLISRGGMASLYALPLLLATGPVLLLRSAIRDVTIEGRRIAVPITVSMIALGWSAVMGWLLLSAPRQMIS